MILRRLALFFALLFGVGATQVPAYVLEYKLVLTGAVNELAAAVNSFDSDAAQQGFTETQGIEHLRANADPLAKKRGDAMQETVIRLDKLRAAQSAFHDAGPIARLGAVVTHYDQRVASGAWSAFEPAVPTSPEAFVFGVLGFLVGGGAMHVAGRPFRRRRDRSVRSPELAT